MTGAQVSKKSTPSTCLSPCIQKRALNFFVRPLGKFEAKGPCAEKNMHPRFTRDEFPCLQLRFQGGQFRLHGFPPLCSMRTIDGLGVGGTVSQICFGLRREDVRLDIGDCEGPNFVR